VTSMVIAKVYQRRRQARRGSRGNVPGGHQRGFLFVFFGPHLTDTEAPPSMRDAANTILRFAKNLGGVVERTLGWKSAIAISIALGLLSSALAVAIVVRWPSDQFKGEAAAPFWAHRHPVIRVVGLVGKNIAGYATVALGIVLALPGVPGQGLLLILIGLTLLNFPGKRRLERRLIRRPSILRGINRVRAKLHHPPLEID
jgi:hypothetical protein